MSTPADVLTLVSAVNAVITLATQIGLSQQKLAMLQQQAALEGRKFNVEDVKRIRDEAQVALDRLNKAIDDAKNVPAPPR